jgi:hypothetical protein
MENQCVYCQFDFEFLNVLRQIQVLRGSSRQISVVTYVAPRLTLKDTTFCLQIVFVFPMDLIKAASFSPHGTLLDWYKIETECAYCVVGTESLNTIEINFRLKRVDKIYRIHYRYIKADIPS